MPAVQCTWIGQKYFAGTLVLNSVAIILLHFALSKPSMQVACQRTQKERELDFTGNTDRWYDCAGVCMLINAC